MPHLSSKLSDVGVSIFARMTALAQQAGALNLAHDFPDFDPPLAAGAHQYAPLPGLPRLRQVISAQAARLAGCRRGGVQIRQSISSGNGL